MHPRITTALALLAAVLTVAGPAGPAGATEPPDLNTTVSLVPSEYRHRLVQCLSLAEDNRDRFLAMIADAPAEEREALAFLLVNMPEPDLTSLSPEFLRKNVHLAISARDRCGWTRSVPKETFLNDVLPYASLNERRDDWRDDFAERFTPLVAGCKSASDAAQKLNREIFKVLNVKYHATKRHKPDQSPYESTEIGYASCTGLSILLVDACRAVGVPARVVGTPMWSDNSGNHTWVEVWDRQWWFVGAAEPGELNKTWFAEPASKADPSRDQYRIYASSFRQTETPFEMVWAPECHDYPAVDVTPYYVERRRLTVEVDGAGDPSAVTVSVRRGPELVAQARGAHAEFELGAGVGYTVAAGMSDEASAAATRSVELPRGADARVTLTLGAAAATAPASHPTSSTIASEDGDPVAGLRAWLLKPREVRGEIGGRPFAGVPLNKAQAAAARELLWNDHAAMIRADRAAEWNSNAITADGKTLRLKTKHVGNKPDGGWNLYISMHGGGNAPASVNDQQWENQIKLYSPPDSLYIAPRAPTDTWNLWHEPHIDVLFGRLIEDAIILGDVNPDRVYIMGYSAGGDGVYQLAPRMADRLAAAAMMAGHPNDASPLGLRNLPFTIHVGADDNGYGRNKVAAEWKGLLDDLQKKDPEGYVHEVQLHAGRGHWMNREDAVAVGWMAKFTRNPLPERVVWKQGSVTHHRFYWLAVPPKEAAKGQLIVADRHGQSIDIGRHEGVSSVIVMLNDRMLDLDRPVVVTADGRKVFEGVVHRTIGDMAGTLVERGDPGLIFDARVPVTLGPAPSTGAP